MEIRRQSKLVLISILIGVIAGFAAMAFSFSIQIFTHLFLGTWVNYLPPDTTGEGKGEIISLWKVGRVWLLPIVTMLGGLLSGILVYIMAKETKGHGTDAAIDAYHQGKQIRARVPFIKLEAISKTIIIQIYE